MILVTFALALSAVGDNEPAVDGRTIFSLLDRYCSFFDDVSFIYEGNVTKPDGKGGDPVVISRFQGLYAFRNDGATLLDVFGFGRGDKPETRFVCSILRSRSEMMNASPDLVPPLRNRTPLEGPGGPGFLNRPDAPERIFLPWYFRSLGDPAEYEVQTQGWEDVNGRHCLRVRMLGRPRPSLNSWVGGLPIVKLWIDLERDGYPLRLEHYRGDDLHTRTEIVQMVSLSLPDRRPIWLPARGRTATFSDFRDGKWTYMKEPFFLENHNIVSGTVKFNQGLNDGFFSVKKHALVANDGDLRKLQRELDQSPKSHVIDPPSDSESVKKRLDDALSEADRQAQRLEASSAARAGYSWIDVFTIGLGALGIATLGCVSFWYWRNR